MQGFFNLSECNSIGGRGGMVDATDLDNWALKEKSLKWKLSNSGKPKSGDRHGNPEPSPKILDLQF